MCRFQCHECDRRFEEPDFVTERHGLEAPPYEKIAVCPYCKGDFEELKQCEICGKWFLEDDLTSGVCDECIYQHDTDIELLYKFGNEEEAEETITINGFIASMFTAEQLSNLGINELRKAKSDGVAINGTEFIGSDKSWFADKIKEAKNDRTGIQTAPGNKPFRFIQN